MKRKICISFLLGLLICLMSVFFVGCQENNGLSFKTLTVEETAVHGTVANDIENFSFIDEIETKGKSKFVVALDIYGSQQVATKTVPLKPGDNTVYIIEMINNEQTTIYTLTIRRRPMYDVVFDTKGGTAVEKQVIEEGYFATEPQTTKAGYTFTGWDYDFTTPITQNTKITAIFETKEEMSNFEFTSTATTCTITAVKDKTITEVSIPDSVTSIGWEAFSGCSRLTSVEIGDSVTSIGDSAFRNCSSLTSVVIPDSVTSIGSSAFSYCGSLTSVEIGDSVTSIGSSAFSGCSSLTSVVIGDSVKSIGWYAFNNCTSLMSVYITDLSAWCYISFGSYDANPLYYAGNLYLNNELVTELVIPDSVTSIRYYAFENCSSLTSIVIPNSVTSIGDYAFYGCRSLTSVEIPDSVTSIGDYAFSYCSSLTSVVIPDSVTSIGVWAFCSCYSLTSVVIPDSVTSIGDCAFYNCSSLTSVEIGDSVTSIGSDAFSGCSSLTSIVIPDSVTSIGDSAFWNCDSLTSIEVSVNNTTYKSLDGNLYSKDGKTLIQYAIGKTATSFTIPDSVTSIGDYAFYNCSSLTSVEIGDSVTSIGDRAFSYCSSLTSIEIPDSVTSIDSYEFSGCSSLTSIVIPDSVTSIGSYVFYNCSSLTSVEIGDSVTSIGSFVFWNCDSLTSVTFKDTSTWYRTTSSSNWQNKTGGTSTSVTNSSTNATYFKSIYGYYDYWYKL